MTELSPPPPKPPQPTEFPPPVRKTIDWLNGCFAEWYRRNPPPMPHRFANREFGFMMWPERPGAPPFVRHRAFPQGDSLRAYLSRVGPHSAYYSTAYYRRPGEMKMADKKWLGAELIFDLDADHLVEAEDAKAAGREMPLEGQLALVKTQFKRLLDDYLLGDFGLAERDVWITFSGSRGYHAHVVEEALQKLDNRERREIVDYVTLKLPTVKGSEKLDFRAAGIIWDEVVDVDKFRSHVKLVKRERTWPQTTPGYRGRLTKALADTLEARVIQASPTEARKWLERFEGIGKRGAESFVAEFTLEKLDRIRAGFLHQGDVAARVLEVLAPELSVKLAKGETDEPVTADTKRLIRLPGSLHGKSGLKVVTLTRSSLDGFDPLRDAIAFPMDESVRILPRNDATATLGGEAVSVKKGEQADVPLPHAVFWLARQNGTIVIR